MEIALDKTIKQFMDNLQYPTSFRSVNTLNTGLSSNERVSLKNWCYRVERCGWATEVATQNLLTDRPWSVSTLWTLPKQTAILYIIVQHDCMIYYATAALCVTYIPGHQDNSSQCYAHEIKLTCRGEWLHCLNTWLWAVKCSLSLEKSVWVVLRWRQKPQLLVRDRSKGWFVLAFWLRNGDIRSDKVGWSYI